MKLLIPLNRCRVLVFAAFFSILVIPHTASATSLESIVEKLNVDQRWVLRQDDVISVWIWDLRHDIWEDETHIHAKTIILTNIKNSSELYTNLSGINSISNLSALVYDPHQRYISRHCSIALKEEKLESLFIHAVKIQMAEANYQAIALQKVFDGDIAISNHPILGKRDEPDRLLRVLKEEYFPKSGSESFWSESDFVLVEANDTPSVRTSFNSTGLTAEFPFRGDVSIMDRAGRPPVTALFRAMTKEVDMVLDRGLKLQLTLPDNLTSPILANQLNLDESKGVLGFSAFGAWTQSGTDLHHVTFLPNRSYESGLLDALFINSVRRTEWSKLWLDNQPWKQAVFSQIRRGNMWKENPSYVTGRLVRTQQ